MKHGFWKIGLLCICLWHALAAAQPLSQEDADRIWQQAKAAAIAGPATIPLTVRDTLQANWALPVGHIYIPQPHAALVLQAMGNPGQDTHLQGLVFPDNQAPWFMSVRFEPAGFVRDREATTWNADDLLRRYRYSTGVANAQRIQQGQPATEILGWAQPPVYDAPTHRLVWATSSKDQGAPATEPHDVNYNTFALGRDGYFSLGLVTTLNALPSYRPSAQALLDALQFVPGKRYTDFNATTDRVADYGLSGLVIGPMAAQQRGWWATWVAVLAPFWPLALLLAAGVGGGLWVWLAKRRKARAAQASEEFAHTVVVAHDATERTQPQPLAPHPHADQVSTR